MTLAVALAVALAFAPRPPPPAAITRVHAGDLLVTGLARQGQRLIAAGEQGRILLADAPAGPWREARITPQREANFSAVEFIGPKLAVAVGHEGWIVRSEDGGETWTEAAFDPERSEPLLAVAGPLDGQLFALGGFGQFLTSADGGRHWQRREHALFGDRHLNAMTRLGDGTLVVVGERGLLARSSDLGASWTALPPIYAGSFFGALPLGARGLLVYGMRGNAFLTADLETWTRARLPDTASMFGAGRDAQGGIVLVGDNGSVLRSADGGRNFAPVLAGERARYTAVLPLAEGGWLVGGESGLRLRSADDAQAAP